MMMMMMKSTHDKRVPAHWNFVICENVFNIQLRIQWIFSFSESSTICPNKT